MERTMLKKIIVSCVVSLILFASVTFSFAKEKENLVLFDIDISGEQLTDAEKSAFQNSLKEALSKDYDVFSGDEVTRGIQEVTTEINEAGSACTEGLCLQKLVRKFNGELIATPSIAKTGEEYIVTIAIKNANTNADITTKTKSCPKCSKGDLIKTLKTILQDDKSGTGIAFVAGGVIDKYTESKIEEISNAQISGDTSSNVAGLIFDSNPKDAIVYLENIKAGKTPYQNLSLESGSPVLITLKKDEYFDKTIRYELKGGFNNLGVIKLLPNFGYLSIETNPSGADVILSGDNIGKSPIKNHKLKYGTYLLDIRKDLYFSISNQKIEIEPEKTNLQTLNLTANFGTLNISTTENNVKIEVYNLKNEKVLEKTSPAELKLNPDQYKVVLSKDKYHSKEYNLQIARDKIDNLSNISLVAQKGTVMISTEPLEMGAKVFIDDKEEGVVPFQKTLFIGTYKVKVETKDKIGEAEIKIEEGKTITKAIILKESGINSIGMEFVLVKAGSFQMGSNDGDSDEKPIHKVNITKDFYIGKYEVTQGQWKKVMGNNPSNFSNCGEDCPVEQVSWNDAQEFIKKLNEKEGINKYRLPTEAEWEYAARGGNKSNGYKYSGTNEESSLSQYANFCDKNCEYDWKDKSQNDGYENTAPVGKFQPNELGIYDMSGNVWEWVEDSYNNSWYSNSPTDNPCRSNLDESRVLRGGSWYLSAGLSRVASRVDGDAAARNNRIGFRVARTF